jgi:hypothetical protein
LQKKIFVPAGSQTMHPQLFSQQHTEWSKSLCAPDDYNTESYKYCSKGPPPVSRHLLTCCTAFSKTVFSIARSTFWMCSVMAIFKSSIVWGLFKYTKSGAQRLSDHPVLILLSWVHTDYLNFRKDSTHCVKWGVHCGTSHVHIPHHIMLRTPSGTHHTPTVTSEMNRYPTLLDQWIKIFCSHSDIATGSSLLRHDSVPLSEC